MDVLLIDEHSIVRAGVRSILQEIYPDLQFKDTATLEEAHQHLPQRSWSLVIMEIVLEGRSTLDLIKTIRQQFPLTPILILSALPENIHAIRTLKAGATGYIQKSSDLQELKQCIEKVAGGCRCISANLAENLAENLHRGQDQAPHEYLSDREYQVMCLLAIGMTVTEIAEEINLSVKTISTYRTRILEKMNMQTNSQIACYAHQHGLIGFVTQTD